MFALGKFPLFLAFFRLKGYKSIFPFVSQSPAMVFSFGLKSYTLLSSPLSKSTRGKPSCFPDRISFKRHRSASACSQTHNERPVQAEVKRKQRSLLAALQELIWLAFQDRAWFSLDAWMHQLGFLGPIPIPVTWRKQDRQISYRLTG